MKILHINSYYSGNKLFKNLFDQQKKQDLDISVYVPVASSFQGNDDEFGTYTTLSRVFNRFDRLIFGLKHAKILNDIKKKYVVEDYTIIHAHSLFSNGSIAMKLKQQYGIPYIVAVRNTDLYIFFEKMIHLRKKGIQILSQAEKIIFLSSAYRDKLVNEYVPPNLKDYILEKSVIIPNGIDDFWQANRALPKTLVDPRQIKLLYVGSINKNKNILMTVKAMELLRNQGIDSTLTIVGEIEDQTIYAQLKQTRATRFIGPIPKEELIKVYRQHDIFVMPSIHETFGLVYAEAMSQGLPVIYTKSQGFDKQFAEGHVGHGVDCFAESEIAAGIWKVVNNYPEISKNCINGSSLFDWKRIAAAYLKVLEEIDKQ